MTFVYGRPVRQKEFLGRESELLTIFNRLRNRESTAIVGEPHIGKTSLLLQIADSKIREDYLLSDAKKFLPVFMDLQPISIEYKPSDFWRDALEALNDKPGHSSTTSKLINVIEENYKNSSLRKLFQHLFERDLVLVLLLDEFDRLLSHPNFTDPSFFAGMRSLSTTTGGLVVITSSRLTVAQMNARGHGLLGENATVSTSPFFNNYIELRLQPFKDDTVTELLQHIPDVFTSHEIHFIRRIAGRHPYLLQAMAATLLEAPNKGEERQVQAAEMFYQRIAFHFDTLWHAMDEKAKTTSVILSLMELGGRAIGSRFAYEEIEQVDAFGLELRNLADLGLAEKVRDGWKLDIQHGLLWQGEQWTISPQAYTWWVRDVVISRSRKIKGYEEWLADQKYRLLLTELQWNELIKLAKNTPELLTVGVGSLVKSIIREIAGIK